MQYDRQLQSLLSEGWAVTHKPSMGPYTTVVLTHHKYDGLELSVWIDERERVNFQDNPLILMARSAVSAIEQYEAWKMAGTETELVANQQGDSLQGSTP